MTLQTFTDSLPQDKQFELAIRMTRMALPVWEKYADTNELAYVDSVVGMSHVVDRQLLSNTIEAVAEHVRLKNSDSKLAGLQSQFVDPIVSLQDNDWELPDEVQKTFYSVYNLLEACLGRVRTIFDELSVYVSINQAADALMTSGRMNVAEIDRVLEEIKSNS